MLCSNASLNYQSIDAVIQTSPCEFAASFLDITQFSSLVMNESVLFDENVVETVFLDACLAWIDSVPRGCGITAILPLLLPSAPLPWEP